MNYEIFRVLLGGALIALMAISDWYANVIKLKHVQLLGLLGLAFTLASLNPSVISSALYFAGAVSFVSLLIFLAGFWREGDAWLAFSTSLLLPSPVALLVIGVIAVTSAGIVGAWKHNYGPAPLTPHVLVGLLGFSIARFASLL